jgi:Na+/pantothenate symporter
MWGAVNPPQFLQDIIVYTGSGLAGSFLAPMVYALYWPRASTFGCMAAMIGGFVAHLSMYVTGIFVNGSFFQPFQLMNFDPILVGLFVSFVVGWVAIRLGPAPDKKLVAKYFWA